MKAMLEDDKRQYDCFSCRQNGSGEAFTNRRLQESKRWRFTNMVRLCATWSTDAMRVGVEDAMCSKT